MAAGAEIPFAAVERGAVPAFDHAFAAGRAPDTMTRCRIIAAEQDSPHFGISQFDPSPGRLCVDACA